MENNDRSMEFLVSHIDFANRHLSCFTEKMGELAYQMREEDFEHCIKEATCIQSYLDEINLFLFNQLFFKIKEKK